MAAAVGHVAAQHVAAGAQVAAAERERRVELEEARVLDTPCASRSWPISSRVGAVGDPHGDAAGCSSSPWKGWKVALIA